MARIRGPLMSMDARGQFGDALLFRGGRKAAHAYRPAARTAINQAPATVGQAAVRTTYRAAIDAWRDLPETDRATWTATATAAGGNRNGWNLFLAAYFAAPPPPPPPDPNTYTTPPGIDTPWPGYTWVSDTAYTPPAGDTWT